MAATGEASEAAAPAAWYPAPGELGAWRWWNSQHWTTDTTRVVVAPETSWTAVRMPLSYMAGAWVTLAYLSVVGALFISRWTDLDPIGLFEIDPWLLMQAVVSIVAIALVDRHLARRARCQR